MTKVASGLNLFDAIEIVGYKENGLTSREVIDSKRTIVRLSSWHRLPKIRGLAIVRYLLWYFQVVLRYARKDIRVIHSNGVEDLMAAVALKVLHPRAKLIYDAHELETERSGWSDLNKRLASWVESMWIYKADAVFVVSGLIGNWYRDRYQLSNVSLVRNIAERSTNVPASTLKIRHTIQANESDVIYLYQGAFFEGRGLEALVTAFRDLPHSFRLVLLGYGRLEASLKGLSQGAGNIHFLPPAHPDEILSYTMQADVGLCLIEDTCLSYRYCLPNKLFEYIQAGLPVLVSDLPELSAFVVDNGCGWQVACEPEAIKSFALQLDKRKHAEAKQRIPQVAEQNSWKLEQRVVEQVYEALTQEIPS